MLRTPVIAFIVLVCSIILVQVDYCDTFPVAAAPEGYEGGSDYLVLEEDDDEFPAESIAFLRSMAQSFRAGFARTLSQSGAPIPTDGDGVSPAGSENDDVGGDVAKQATGGGGQVMTYIQTIMDGFKSLGKSIRDMFMQIASLGGQRLANRVQKRMDRWVSQAPAAASGLAQQAQSAGEGASARKPF